jgi:MFS family permease
MRLFISRNFFLLWSGQVVSQIGDSFYMIALAWWLLEKTGSTAAMGLFLVASTLPEMLLGPFAGGFADRFNRKVIIVAADILRGLVVLTVTLLQVLDALAVWHCFVAAVLLSIGTAFFNPTLMAVIPQVVERDELPRANALSQMVSGGAKVLGPVAGAAFVSIAGYGPVFLVNALSYLVSALLEGFLSLPDGSTMKEEKMLQGLKEGIRFILRSREVLVIILVIALVHVFFGSLSVSAPFLARSLNGNGVQNLGYLEGMIGGGMVLGAVLIHLKKANSRSCSLFTAVVVAGLCFVTLGIINSTGLKDKLPYLAVFLLIGFSVATASVYWRSLLQVQVPNEMAGRVFGVCTTVANLSLPLSFGTFGALLTHFSIAVTLTSCGTGLVAAALILMLYYRRLVHFKDLPVP